MSIRKACVKRGHRWYVFTGMPAMPFQFCSRMFCDGERVNPDFPMDEELRALFERVVAENMRKAAKK